MYQEISKTEFEGLMTDMGFASRFFASENGVAVGEYIYEREVPGTGLAVRIYSSVSEYTDTTREVGTDAIRIGLIEIESNKPASAFQRVNRTEGALKNTRIRAREAWKKATSAPKCNTCGETMRERKGKFGKFWGCVNFWKGCKGKPAN